MRIGEALGAWLNDRPAKAASVAAMERLGQRVKRMPALAGLERSLDGLSEPDPETVLDAGRRFLANEAAVEHILSELVSAALEDPFVRPPLRMASSDIHTSMMLLDRPELMVMIAMVTPDRLAAKRRFASGARSISFGGQRSLFRFLRSGGATISFWEAPSIGPRFQGETAAPCRLVETRRIVDGETIELDGARQSFVIDRAFGDIVYLQALTPLGAAPLMVEYDSATLAYAGASSADDVGSRVGMMLSLLRAMDRGDAAPLFAALLPTLNFHDRWQAMREFLALDAAAAFPHLRDMAAGDPHPEVRAAAAQTLAAFFQDAEESEPCPA